MREERKRKRAGQAGDEHEGDASLNTALVVRTASRSRLDREQVSKLARSSCTAEVYGSKCAFSTPSVRKVRSAALSSQRAPQPSQWHQEVDNSVTRLFKI